MVLHRLFCQSAVLSHSYQREVTGLHCVHVVNCLVDASSKYGSNAMPGSTTITATYDAAGHDAFGYLQLDYF
ncbi:hypothetical protein OH76DRAFT_53567 [Lentinus brumalis]|uniref:Uncharacterized protein n=1 Tax=Lentinus brumalis TaxID=2498619 RepID=A0A371DYH0_9APHY|nr:hypothetical protein OH76DRAFT_53567 [Polyporus brumalis]